MGDEWLHQSCNYQYIQLVKTIYNHDVFQQRIIQHRKQPPKFSILAEIPLRRKMSNLPRQIFGPSGSWSRSWAATSQPGDSLAGVGSIQQLTQTGNGHGDGEHAHGWRGVNPQETLSSCNPAIPQNVTSMLVTMYTRTDSQSLINHVHHVPFIVGYKGTLMKHVPFINHVPFMDHCPWLTSFIQYRPLPWRIDPFFTMINNRLTLLSNLGGIPIHHSPSWTINHQPTILNQPLTKNINHN